MASQNNENPYLDNLSQVFKETYNNLKKPLTKDRFTRNTNYFGNARRISHNLQPINQEYKYFDFVNTIQGQQMKQAIANHKK